MKERFDFEFIAENFLKILQAVPVTLGLTLAALAVGWSLGLLLAFGKCGKNDTLRRFLNGCTDLVRGIPTIALLFLVFFGLPALIRSLTGISTGSSGKVAYAVLALGLEISATSSELAKSAYDAVGVWQVEAGRALGLNQRQIFTKIMLPQMVRIILPNLGSSVLAAMQGTALVYSLGIYDVLGRARQIDTTVSYTKSLELYLIAALIYWGLALLSDLFFRKMEKKIRWDQQNLEERA